LEREVEKTKSEHGRYSPDVLDYVRTCARRDEKESQSNPPPRNSIPGIVNVADLEKNVWLPWPHEVVGTEYASDRLGIGPGERRLVAVIGGAVMGTTTSYDIVTNDSLTWEVKQVNGPTDTIRLAIEGANAYNVAKDKLKHVLLRMRSLVELKGKISGAEAMLNSVNEFLDDQYDRFINYGEVPREALVDFRSTLKTCGAVKRLASARSAHSIYALPQFNVGDVSFHLDADAYVEVAEVIRKRSNVVLPALNPCLRAIVVLNHVAFDDPDGFINSWFEGIDVASIFSKASGGVILVNEKCFKIIPKNDVTEQLHISRISQGRPILKQTHP
jgi:hypothetical protein